MNSSAFVMVSPSKTERLRDVAMAPFALVFMKLETIVRGFADGLIPRKNTPLKQCAHPDQQLREDLSEKQIDRMVEDSFPASDPPSTY